MLVSLPTALYLTSRLRQPKIACLDLAQPKGAARLPHQSMIKSIHPNRFAVRPEICQSLNGISSQVTLGCAKLTPRANGNRHLCSWFEKLRHRDTSCVRSGKCPDFSELLFLFPQNGDHPVKWNKLHLARQFLMFSLLCSGTLEEE